jgi:hypothetical protein
LARDGALIHQWSWCARACAIAQFGLASLALASMNGHSVVVSVLLDKGAPIDAVDKVSSWVPGGVGASGARGGGCSYRRRAFLVRCADGLHVVDAREP